MAYWINPESFNGCLPLAPTFDAQALISQNMLQTCLGMTNTKPASYSSPAACFGL